MLQTLLCLGFLAFLPPEAGEILGFDPRTTLSFAALYERETAPKKEPERTVKEVEIANCGGNRFVFGIHFWADYPADNGVLILYVDSDGSPETGRKNHGCVFMLTLHNRRPTVTDISPGYDHISAAIGGAIAAACGADFLCYVTPTEHLSIPGVEEVREGVIALRIAAHAADIAKGVAKAGDWDRELSQMRKNLDWEGMIRLSVDPERARRIRERSPSRSSEVCSMCGEYCVIKNLEDLFRK